MPSPADAIQKKINKKSPNNQPDAKKTNEQSQEFVDNRNQTNKANSIADLANDGNSAMQLKAFNLLANSSSPVQQLMAIQQDPVQAKMLQLKGVEAELPVQGKFKNGTIQQKSAEGTSQNSKSNNTGLPTELKSGVEQLSGHSMDDVKVNYNSNKPRKMLAHAYAQGTDIHVAPGQEKHIAHEAWHVAQQKSGKVKPTTTVNGAPVNDNPGLEKEADSMGQKAMSVGSSLGTMQHKLKSGTKINGKVQQHVGEEEVLPIAEPAAEIETEVVPENTTAPDPVVMAKIQKNRGLINMAQNASVILNNRKIWTSLGKKEKEDSVEKTAKYGKMAGVTIKAAGSTQDSPDDTSATEEEVAGEASSQTSIVSEAAGDIISAVGAGISSLFSSISAVSNFYKAGKNRDLVAGAEGTKDVISAVRAGFQTAESVLKYISGSIPAGIADSIPGLGIVVSAANIMIKTYQAVMASSAEAEMGEVSEGYRTNLKNQLKTNNPEKNVKLFQVEKRGKMFSRKEYLRISKKAKIFLETTKESADPDEVFDKGKAAFGIPPDVSFHPFYDAVQFYELGSKMQEINQKRKVGSQREIATEMIMVAAKIAALFPGDGGITATALLGTSLGIKGAFSVSKAIQHAARKEGVLGGDQDRSKEAKYGEYIGHTKSIYRMLTKTGLADKVDESITNTDIQKAKKVEKVIEAAGASKHEVYKTKYTDIVSVIKQVKTIVDSMTKGR